MSISTDIKAGIAEVAALNVIDAGTSYAVAERRAAGSRVVAIFPTVAEAAGYVRIHADGRRLEVFDPAGRPVAIDWVAPWGFYTWDRKAGAYEVNVRGRYVGFVGTADEARDTLELYGVPDAIQA